MLSSLMCNKAARCSLHKDEGMSTAMKAHPQGRKHVQRLKAYSQKNENEGISTMIKAYSQGQRHVYKDEGILSRPALLPTLFGLSV